MEWPQKAAKTDKSWKNPDTKLTPKMDLKPEKRTGRDLASPAPWKQTHRGLRRSDIVARTELERGLRWAMFKRGAWPPTVWNVPAALEGVALLQMIEERSAMYVPAWKAAKRKGKRENTEH